MEDAEIVELFLRRDSAAIGACERKYAAWCRKIALNILQSREDAEECVNDAMLRLWNAVPPERPENLRAYLGRVVRNLALNRLETRSAKKRGGEMGAALSELEACVSGTDGDIEDAIALRDALDGFLAGLRPRERAIFMKRYWFLTPIDEIARQENSTASRVASMLFRLRKRLRVYLEKEGFQI